LEKAAGNYVTILLHSLAADIRSLDAKEHTWLATVKGSEPGASVTLTWEAEGNTPSLYLLDTYQDKAVSLTGEDGYHFRLPATGQAEFMITTQSPNSPESRLFLKQVF